MLVDTHCHLPSLNQRTELDSCINEARNAGVEKLINIGTSLKSNLEAIEVAKHYDNVFAAIGIYPNEQRKQSLGYLQSGLGEQVLNYQPQIVALGECGLDISQWQNQRPLAEQVTLFQSQIELAIKYHLPLIIHNRKANEEILNALQPYKSEVKGVFHCFVGSKKFLQQVLDLGFYVGVTGLVTYDQGLQEVIKAIPLDRLLVETDSPYLTPEPIRQQKRWPNEPKNVTIVAEKVAELLGDSFLAVAEQTTRNAETLFNLSKHAY